MIERDGDLKLHAVATVIHVDIEDALDSGNSSS